MPARSTRRIGVFLGIPALAGAIALGHATPALGQTGFGMGGSSSGGFGGGGAGFGGGGAGFGGGGAGFGGSMGSGFSGGSGSFGTGLGGGGFGSSSSSFAPSQFTGTSFSGGGISGLGGTGARGSSTAGGVSSGIQPGNVLGAYYANPLAAGLPNLTRVTFGTPLYTTTTSVSQMTTGLGASRPGGAPGVGGAVAAPAATPGGAPSYAAVIGFSHPPVTATPQIQRDIEAILTRSTSLNANRAIRVDVVGDTVVLRGMVADDHDRRMAEGLIRLTPGVRDVRNELQTLEALPPPERTP
jgi:hypothetical protein